MNALLAVAGAVLRNIPGLVLTAMLYYLLCNPVAYERLQSEVDSAFPSGEEPLDVTRLSQMEWLNGCM